MYVTLIFIWKALYQAPFGNYKLVLLELTKANKHVFTSVDVCMYYPSTHVYDQVFKFILSFRKTSWNVSLGKGNWNNIWAPFECVRLNHWRHFAIFKKRCMVSYLFIAFSMLLVTIPTVHLSPLTRVNHVIVYKSLLHCNTTVGIGAENYFGTTGL